MHNGIPYKSFTRGYQAGFKDMMAIQAKPPRTPRFAAAQLHRMVVDNRQRRLKLTLQDLDTHPKAVALNTYLLQQRDMIATDTRILLKKNKNPLLQRADAWLLDATNAFDSAANAALLAGPNAEGEGFRQRWFNNLLRAWKIADEAVNEAKHAMVEFEAQTSAGKAALKRWYKAVPEWEGHLRKLMNTLKTYLSGNRFNNIRTNEGYARFYDDLFRQWQQVYPLLNMAKNNSGRIAKPELDTIDRALKDFEFWRWAQAHPGFKPQHRAQIVAEFLYEQIKTFLYDFARSQGEYA